MKFLLLGQNYVVVILSPTYNKGQWRKSKPMRYYLTFKNIIKVGILRKQDNLKKYLLEFY